MFNRLSLMFAIFFALNIVGCVPTYAQYASPTPVVDAIQVTPETPPSEVKEQAPGTEVTVETSADDELYSKAGQAIQNISTILKTEGLSKMGMALSIALILCQLLVFAFKTKFLGQFFEKVGPKSKFVIVTLTTMIVTILPLMQGGASFLAALTSGAVINAIMVYGHQAYKLFFEKTA